MDAEFLFIHGNPNKMPKLTLLVGPPGSGKSTLANSLVFEDGDHGYKNVRVSQDDQGKEGHMEVFNKALQEGRDIIVDRLNFVKIQRERYLKPAREAGYTTEIIVLHESYQTCRDRMAARKDHPTIKDETSASQALNMFFSKYERVEDSEADKVTRVWPEGYKPSIIVCDLDGTLCNCEHRRHLVRPDTPTPGFKKNWKAFFAGIPDDTINQWCDDIIMAFAARRINTVFCSGRDENQRKMTQEWLARHAYAHLPLYMRNRQDSRQDSIIKEIILDFELLTRYTPYFFIDDRSQVVQMWRRRGFVCLQCDNGEF